MDTKTINLRDLPEEVWRRAKACAALHGMTLKDFVIRAIAKATEEDIPVTPIHNMAALSVHKSKRKKKA